MPQNTVPFTSTCPECGEQHHFASEYEGRQRTPDDGDASVCFTCSTPSVFRRRDDGALVLIRMAEPWDPEIQRVVSAVRASMREIHERTGKRRN